LKSVCLQYSLLIFLAVLLFRPGTVSAQGEVDYAPMVDLKDGLGISRSDSLFKINVRFRMQNRMELFSRDAENLSLDEVDARVRRLRLRMDGFLMNPRFAYYIQLSFSRGDQDFDDTGIPNVVRDAMFYYYFNKRFYMGFGQGKLAGNRQRVISSGQLQFAERALVNGFFNIDRDFGWFLNFSQPVGDMQINTKASITTGEGRNQLTTNNGLAYTGRFEWLPMGAFINKSDYAEADLERHPTPKLSLAATYHYNEQAVRSRGQTGRNMSEAYPFTSVFVDLIFKYRGFSFLGEWMNRTSEKAWINWPNPSLTPLVFPVLGQGANAQAGYLFRNNYELAARYSFVNFHESIRQNIRNQEMISLGGSKYLNKHRIKLQSNLSYHIRNSDTRSNPLSNRWSLMFQVELGI
jgi:phosphate-selective porin OprO and OprP